MKRRARWIAIIICVAAAVAGGYVWWEVHTGGQWYKVTYDGEPVGYIHLVEEYEQYEGRKVWAETVEQRFRHGNLAETGFSSRYQLRRELDGQFIMMKGTFDSGRVGEWSEFYVVVADGMLRWTTTEGLGQADDTVELPKDTKVYAEVNAWLLKQHGIGPGDEAEFHVVSFFDAAGHRKAIVKKVERVKHVHEGEEVNALRVVIESTGRAAGETVLIMTESYDLLKQTEGDQVLVRSSRAEALANFPPGAKTGRGVLDWLRSLFE